MFTGIIETVGTVSSVTRVDGDLRLLIAVPDYRERDIALGDSIACNGVCLTVVERDAEHLGFDVSVESINHSLIGDWQTGTTLNIEMALLATCRLGGHLVSGHVDGLATLVDLVKDGRSWRLVFQAPHELKKYIAKKGSITINGCSLTVNLIKDNRFDINVIPHTFKTTTVSELAVGDRVHIEVDIIARYLERLLIGESSAESNLSQSFLAEHGFA